jgi:hypothetical protein
MILFASAKKRTAKLVHLTVLDPAESSYRQPMEILVAPLCGESLFWYQPALSFIKRSMFIERVPAARVSRTRGELNAILDL